MKRRIAKILMPSQAIMSKYRIALKKLVKRMTSETEKKLWKLLDRETAKQANITFAQDDSLVSQAKIQIGSIGLKFKKLFNKKSKQLAIGLIEEVNAASNVSILKTLKTLSEDLKLKGSVLNTIDTEIGKALIQENVALFRTIPETYFKEIQKQVMNSISSGEGIKQLKYWIQLRSKKTERHAELAVLDQTRKAYNAISAVKMVDSGIKKFQWIHSSGSRHPRKLHVTLNNKVFSFDDRPIIQENPEIRGLPGYLPNCRCRMRPIFDIDGEEV